MLDFRACLIGFLCVLITACSTYKQLEEHDPSLELPREDYAKILTGQNREEVIESTPAPVVEAPKPIPLPTNFQKPVSVTISESQPLKGVLMALAQQAKVNLILDPNINGSLFYHANNESFSDVITEICNMANLRFRVSGKTIRIEPDLPYAQTYNVQFLSLARENQTRISSATDVFTSMDGYNRDFDNGSSTLVTGQSKMDFWEELTQNLDAILGQTSDGSPHLLTIHKHAGIISVQATYKQQKCVQTYLQEVMENVGQQVLIEAKIVEVNLDEEFKSGINWHRIQSDFKIDAPLGSIATLGAFNPSLTPERNVFTIGSSGKTLTALASVLNKFGTVRTLSSPRLTVMNNQAAVMKVATNFVFFKINYSREIREDDKNDVERASSQIQTVPIGLVMTVQPNINARTGRITLSLRPTISRVVTQKEDPAVGILSSHTTTSYIPEVQVREMDSILHVNSGDVTIMGGLMQERSDNEQNGVPGVEDISLIGNLFKAKENKHSISELVIFLRATIANTPKIAIADKQIYNTFTHDPRPLSFT
jgi:general secretion pathway protein D